MNSASGVFRRNVGVVGFGFYLENKVNQLPVTNGTPIIYYTLDGGVQGQVSNAAVHEGNGQWSVNLSAAEMNGEIVALLITHPDSTGQNITIKTDCDVKSFQGDSAAVANLAAGANQLYPFTVGAGVTATSIPTGITGAPYSNANHFEGAVVLINQERRRVNASAGSPVVLTTQPFQSVPSQNDAGVIT